MQYITEMELRDLFSNGIPEAYEIPRDARLTPAAKQYLVDLRLYRSQAVSQSQPASPKDPKPEYMTHLDAKQLTHKSHPRIALRGKLDSLEADVILAQITVQTAGGHRFEAPLEEVLALIRRVLAADVTGKPLGDWTLGDMTAGQIRDASHHPEQFGFRGHVLPSASQGMIGAVFNRLRTQARETELAVIAAFCQGDKSCSRQDLLLAMNRLSSYFYVLQLQAIKEQE
ncbi:MAG: hypothetical protein GX781_00300 [Clostridiales bacterium]|nr:hypothetical protein [Clostridiales bacterium]